jgi:glycosyltransferase involved in cell wall biosynthesis
MTIMSGLIKKEQGMAQVEQLDRHTRSENEQSLKLLECQATAGTLHIDDIYRISDSIQRCALGFRRPGMLRRLGLLFRKVGALDDARQCLASAHAMDPQDRATCIGLANVQIDLGHGKDALACLESLIKIGCCDTTLLSKAAIVAKSMGELERSLEWRRQAARNDKGALPTLIAELIACSRAEEVLRLVRAQLDDDLVDAKLAFQCFSALKKFSTNADEIVRARKLVLQAGMREEREKLWQARVLKREGELELAFQTILGVPESQTDPELRREAASMALSLGHWGRDAAAIQNGIEPAEGFPQLRNDIARADRLLHLFGGSLGSAATDPKPFTHVRTPESVFQYVCESAPHAVDASRQGAVMIANSMAAGGAERIIAICAKYISRKAEFNPFKLYLFDVDSERSKDFYLPLTGLSREEIVILDTNRAVSEPLSLLPHVVGRQVQCILEQLLEDRPRIVHVSLEPLSLYAGLAAIMADVEHVVLHTHNMRPTTLNPDGLLATRMADCYRALLRRPEVSLIGCANACVRDYRDWLNLEPCASAYTVHNGIEFPELIERDREEAIIQLRREYGIASGCPVIGTAFRFEEVKQPFLWVDVAAAVHAKRPECRFVMFGDGTLRPAILEYIRSKGLTGVIVLPGLVTGLASKLIMLNLFVLTSRTEALPNVLLEAQAAGVPVIAFDVGGISETMIEGVTGFLVPRGSIEGMIAAILRALGDPEWSKHAIDTGIKFVRQEFSMEKMVENLTKVLMKDGLIPTSGGRM